MIFRSHAFHRGHERSYDSRLKARCQILYTLRNFFAVLLWLQAGLAHIFSDGGFQSTKTEIRPVVAHARQRKLYRVWIPFPCQPFNDWPAGIAQTEQLRNFVESLTSSIIAGAADYLVFAGFGNIEEVCVPTRNNQCQRRVFDRRVFKTDRIDVTLDMIHADQRLVQRKGHSLCVRDPDQKRPHQARADGHGDSFNVVWRNLRARECLFDNRNDLVEMLARSEFRHDAAEARMRFDLGRYDRRDDFATVSNNRSRSLIT